MEKMRIKRVVAGNLETKIKNVVMEIRDYPAPIVNVGNVSFEGSLMVVKRIFSETVKYLQGSLTFGNIELNIGLNQLSGIK